MLTLGEGWCHFWHRPWPSPTSAHAPPSLGRGRPRRQHHPYIITSLIYNKLRATPDSGRIDLYRNSYRILKKIYNSNKTFWNLTNYYSTISVRSRYNYSNVSGVSKSIHITIAWPCLRIISRYICTHSFPKTKRTFPTGANRGPREADKTPLSPVIYTNRYSLRYHHLRAGATVQSGQICLSRVCQRRDRYG